MGTGLQLNIDYLLMLTNIAYSWPPPPDYYILIYKTDVRVSIKKKKKKNRTAVCYKCFDVLMLVNVGFVGY